MKLIISLILLCVVAPGANANVGIPIVAVGVPFMLMHLLVVVGIECFVLKKLRKDLPTKQVWKQVLKANLLTTLIGYPVVAGLEALFPLIGLNIGWLLPFPNLDKLYIYTGTVMVLSLIPCYFLSVYVEGRWLKKRLSREITKKDIYKIHNASYAYLVAACYLLNPITLMGVFHSLYKLIDPWIKDGISLIIF